MSTDSPRRSLTTSTLLKVAFRIAAVVVVATLASYWHVTNGLRAQALEQLSKYIEQRGVRESSLFVLARDNLETFAAEMGRRLDSGEDPGTRFDELFARHEDGTMRLREAAFERHGVTAIVAKNVELDAELRRELSIGFDMLARFGPAWSNRFLNLYLTFPEGAVMMYWPTRAWGLEVSSWEMQGKLALLFPESQEVVVTGESPGATHAPSWSDLYYDYGVRDWLVSAVEPVASKGEYVLSVANDVLLQELFERTVNQRLEGTYNVLFRADGRLIAHPRFMDAIQAQSGDLSIPETDDANLNNIYRRVTASDPSQRIIENAADDQYLAVSPLHGPAWYLVTVFPKSLIADRAFRTAGLILVMGAGALVLELTILFWVLRRQVARPLSRLMEATARVASGDFSRTLDESREDELGQLARRFNHMSRELASREEALSERSVELEEQLAERRRAEKEQHRLLDELLKLSAVIEATSDLVGVTTLTGRFLYMNPAGLALTGRSPQDVGTLKLFDVHTPQANARLRSEILPNLYTTGFWSGELSLRRADGEEVPVSLVLVIVRDRGGEPTALGTIMRDISEVKRAERELLDAQRELERRVEARTAELREAKESAEAATRAKSRFLANMSHELRTPLNAIIGISEMLQEEAEDLGYHDFLEPLERTLGAGRHLLHLIDEVLDLSRIEAGRVELRPEELDVAGLLEQVATTARPLAEKNGNRLDVVCPRDVGRIHADPLRLRQILLNLLGNAAKFTENGSIRVVVSRQRLASGDWLAFAVRDTGVGITREQMGRLFQEFSQLDPVARRGAGLGLAISRRYCRLMGGDIELQSEPGRGSTFTVRLPAGTAAPPAAAEAAGLS